MNEMLIRFCAPTLANLKIASLFSCRVHDANEFYTEVSKVKAMLEKKGITLRVIQGRNDLVHIYIYRLDKLFAYLNDSKHKMFLQECGYTAFDVDGALDTLSKHLLKEDFPHEIGVFLGYPIDDIKAFIKYKGKEAKFVGCWKAYSNVEHAKYIFKKYKECTNAYLAHFRKGMDLNNLIVS